MSGADSNPDTQNGQHAKGELRRHDLIIAVIIWCVSLATLIESWRLTFALKLPGVEPEQVWLVAPGLFPLALSIGLLFMFSVIIWVALKEGDFKGHFSLASALGFVNDAENIRHIVQIALLCLYVFVLLGRIHFGVASALYMFAAMLTARAATWYVTLIMSIAFATTVSYLFGSVMQIPLP